MIDNEMFLKAISVWLAGSCVVFYTIAGVYLLKGAFKVVKDFEPGILSRGEIVVASIVVSLTAFSSFLGAVFMTAYLIKTLGG